MHVSLYEYGFVDANNVKGYMKHLTDDKAAQRGFTN
jgi:hypothetical protein